jgi:hypothetical protein
LVRSDEKARIWNLQPWALGRNTVLIKATIQQALGRHTME